jgi:4-amino-4-deoxy-L-arabinose transferase-like glycosyltransferase
VDVCWPPVLSVSTARDWLARGTPLRGPRASDLILIGLLALVLRGAWALVYGRVEAGPGDAFFFQVVAANLAAGDGYTWLGGEPTAHAPPGFPFLVALLYEAFGEHVKLALGLNVLLGAATAVLLYLIARAALGRAAGLVAGASFAILPAPIFFTGLFLSESAFLFCAVGFLALAIFLPQRAWTPAALGVATGLAALTKGEGLLLLAIPLAIWWGQIDRGAWLRRAAVLVGAMALTIAPWTIRNARELDAFVPVATNVSAAVWQGHNDAANGGRIALPESLPPGEVAKANRLRDDALEWAVRNPHKELGLIPRKLISLGNAPDRAFSDWVNAPGQRELGTSGVLAFGVLADALDYLLIFLTLAALVLIGGGRLWRLHPVMRGALAYLGASLVLYGFVSYGQYRFRLAMEPMMILVAAPLVVSLPRLRGEA